MDAHQLTSVFAHCQLSRRPPLYLSPICVIITEVVRDVWKLNI